MLSIDPIASRCRSARPALASCLSLLALLAVSGIPAAADPVDNGIVVGNAKLFDERSLETMLSSVQSSLAGSNYINPAAVAQNEGMVQGGEFTSTSTQLSATDNPQRPTTATSSSTTTTTKAPTGTTTATAITTVPVLNTPGNAVPGPLAPTFTSDNIGVSAPLAVSSEDMLQQQVGLSFEASNLQLLLEHALSDRVIFTKGDSSAAPRTLAVLGFQISVDPRNDDKYAVAEAEITITNPHDLPASSDGSPLRPEVALMLPQDKTYNVAKVTNDSHTIGLGSFAQPFGGSISAGRSHNSAFVVYDVDTVALQRPSPDANSVSFAWQFRPVLGQKAVQPGTRQVYVLLSLPVSSGEEYDPTITVKTYWKKLDAKSSTVGDPIAGEGSSYKLDPISIHNLNDYDDALQPKIDDVDTFDAGNGQIYVEATGSNFSKNMTVVLNGVSNSVYEQDGRTLSFTAPITSMAYTDPIIVGPYGLPVDLEIPVLKDQNGDEISTAQNNEGIKISQVTAVPIDAENTDLQIQLVSRHSSTTAAYSPALPSNAQLVVTIGDEVYGLNDNPVDLENDSNSSAKTIDVHVPNSVLQSGQKVTVRYLFAGNDNRDRYHSDYRDDYQLPAATFSVDDVTIVSKDPDPAPKPAVAASTKPSSGKRQRPASNPTQLVVLALQGHFHKSLTAYIYYGTNRVEFDPTSSVADSFLLLQDSSSIAPQPKTRGSDGSGASTNRTGNGIAAKRGAVPLTNEEQASTTGKSYNLALLTVKRDQIMGSSYIVFYEPGSPAQLLPLATCLKALAKPAVPTSPATIPIVPSQWEMWGTWGPNAPASASITTAPPGANTAAPYAGTNAPAPSAAPDTPPSQITMEMGSKTVTGTGAGDKAIKIRH